MSAKASNGVGREDLKPGAVATIQPAPSTDLASSPDIRIEDLAEAIHYRSLDREGWAG